MLPQVSSWTDSLATSLRPAPSRRRRSGRSIGSCFSSWTKHEIVRRIGGRRGCSKGHTYHVDDRPSGRPGICDVDGEPLEQRPDDSEEVIRNRLAVYRRETEPLIDFYDGRGLIVEIKALGSVEHITEQILEALHA